MRKCMTFILFVLFCVGGGAARAEMVDCTPQHAAVEGIAGVSLQRTVCADVVALDQTLVYNRFGSFNPFGMIFALRRDVVPAGMDEAGVDCDAADGTADSGAALEAGEVRLRKCKRPRPMVLRANVGDLLHVKLTNLLRKDAPDLSYDYCPERLNDPFPADVGGAVSTGPEAMVEHGEATCASVSSGGDPAHDWPETRGVSFAIQGLTAVMPAGAKVDPKCLGEVAVLPGESVDCYYAVLREGPYFLTSTAAPAGGEGEGGSLTHGLFGAVNVEKTDTTWYRSQVSQGAMAAARKNVANGPIDYKATNAGGIPILRMLKELSPGAHEIVHADLNAIIESPEIDPKKRGADRALAGPRAFREFSVFFHDELKSFTTGAYDELGQFGEGQLAGVRDGFAINYGASGMGTMLLANRKGIGPAANCAECLYEEFFLTSWANGDPALLETYGDDPSNVHHSYLNDAVVFRNFHAGPKETHVFHLHAHQWFAGNDANRGAYLDSQTVGPQQAFSYDISGGGLEVYRRDNGQGGGWWETLGSGNRNRTVGDSIFHCHLYPHFAQGMWELWRVHDVFEDGTRKLPDGQWTPGLSLTEEDAGTKAKARPGSVDRATGRRIVYAGTASSPQLGTPIPAIVPLPDQALPPAPTYPDDGDATLDAAGAVDAPAVAEVKTFPGYPFYIPGRPGHRPPQAPMDIARALDGASKATGDLMDGGLPRHLVLDGTTRKPDFDVPALPPLGAPNGQRAKVQTQIVAKALALGDLTMHFETAGIEPLEPDGEPLERAAMAFHHDGKLGTGTPVEVEAVGAPGIPVSYDAGQGGYILDGTLFPVNGAAPKPGAPFADPCGAPEALAAPAGAGTLPLPWKEDDPFIETAGAFVADPGVIGYRRYEASAVQLDLVTNRAGWHDPQARINVLSKDAGRFKDAGAVRQNGFSPQVSASEAPFFFRALSGECIEFRHTNELPKDLELDDFQVKTPTDTIGQHIHLVKFDVTASDGSGNGWNYEDGTFAPDEIAARLCAWSESPDPVAAAEAKGILLGLADKVRAAQTPASGQTKAAGGPKLAPDTDFCDWGPVATHDVWRLKRDEYPFLFQTTIQRWFADPILSNVRHPRDDRVAAGKADRVDRTLRTVFSHDHFGPSSIQQHGFYTALLIEERDKIFCETAGVDDLDVGACTTARTNRTLLTADERDVGPRKILRPATSGSAPFDSDADVREFALAVADFATLYDPRDRTTEEEVAGRMPEDRAKGMATLLCEAKHAGDPAALRDFCHSGMTQDGGWHGPAGDAPPAWVAVGRPKDAPLHRLTTLVSLPQDEVDALQRHLVGYRRMAAGYRPTDGGRTLAQPVAPPRRPESISVDHHDPYLLNYRGEPIPLRVGQQSGGCALKPVDYWESRLAGPGVSETCSVKTQAKDMSVAFRTDETGEPVTPVLNSRDGDTVYLRLIQGAQEVQHAFTIEDHTLLRNVDQNFPSGMVAHDDITPDGTLVKECERLPFSLGGGPVALSRLGRPDEYEAWLNGDYEQSTPAFWKAYEDRLARCFNAEGRIAAQEVGISEHFEFKAAYRFDSNIPKALAMQYLQRAADPAPLPEIERLPDALRDLGPVIGRLRELPVVPEEGTARALDEITARLEAFPREGLSPSDVTVVEDALAVARARPRTLAEVFDMSRIIGPFVDGLDRKGAKTDGLFHFGSQDALWNGAWGLMRVHRQDDTEMDRPVDTCKPGAPREQAVVAAVSTRRLDARAAQTGATFPARTPYGDTLFDADGLFFALVDPTKLMKGLRASPVSGSSVDPGDPLNWPQVPVDNLLDAVLDAYTRPEPLVLNVNAGDCVRIVLLNGLEQELRDLPGDARMPPITPLNVERDWPKMTDADDPETVTAGAIPTVQPSASLAVNLPLPLIGQLGKHPRPTGEAVAALTPARHGLLHRLGNDPDGGTGQIDVFEVYAGLAYAKDVTAANLQPPALPILAPLVAQNYVGDVSDIVSSFATDFVPRLKSSEWLFPPAAVEREIKAVGTGAVLTSDGALPPIGRSSGLILFEGGGLPQLESAVSKLTVEQRSELGAALRTAQSKLLDDFVGALNAAEVAAATSGKIHYIPYAFGALPFRSMADVIGHVPQGLFGALVVVPEGAKIDDGTKRADSSCAGQSCKLILPGAKPQRPFGMAVLDAPPAGEGGKERHTIRQFTVFWQDGLGLRDGKTHDRHVSPGFGNRWKLVADCLACDDSYDLGEKGVSFRSEPFHVRLRDDYGFFRRLWLGLDQPESHFNLNRYDFGRDFWRIRAAEIADPPMPVLRAQAGEEVVIHVVHPGGRARQRAFITVAQDYDDLFPGFGFPRSALLAPGKAVTAALTLPVTTGCYLWYDGPTTTRAGGAWGLLEVVPDLNATDLGAGGGKRPCAR